MTISSFLTHAQEYILGGPNSGGLAYFVCFVYIPTCITCQRDQLDLDPQYFGMFLKENHFVSICIFDKMLAPIANVYIRIAFTDHCLSSVLIKGSYSCHTRANYLRTTLCCIWIASIWELRYFSQKYQFSHVSKTSNQFNFLTSNFRYFFPSDGYIMYHTVNPETPFDDIMNEISHFLFVYLKCSSCSKKNLKLAV